MERATFEQRFLKAAAQARDFARQFIAEPLPDAMLFHVHLNGSYDLNAGPEFTLLPRWVVIPRTLRQLALHAPLATDDDVCRVLAGCPDGLEQVSLRGSPVSVRVLEALERFAGLTVVDASDTQIPNESLWRFAASRHDFRCSPWSPQATTTDD